LMLSDVEQIGDIIVTLGRIIRSIIDNNLDDYPRLVVIKTEIVNQINPLKALNKEKGELIKRINQFIISLSRKRRKPRRPRIPRELGTRESPFTIDRKFGVRKNVRTGMRVKVVRRTSESKKKKGHKLKDVVYGDDAKIGKVSKIKMRKSTREKKAIISKGASKRKIEDNDFFLYYKHRTDCIRNGSYEKICYICKKNEGEVMRCNEDGCKRVRHISCGRKCPVHWCLECLQQDGSYVKSVWQCKFCGIGHCGTSHRSNKKVKICEGCSKLSQKYDYHVGRRKIYI